MCTDLRFLRKKIIVLRPAPAALFDVAFRMNLQRSERGYGRCRAGIWTLVTGHMPARGRKYGQTRTVQPSYNE